jgi:mRNA interferase RelE/StbE
VPSALLYRPEVAQEELPRIPRNVQFRIADAPAVGLRETPEQSGQLVRGTLRGEWKLRVGNYRAVFKIVSDEVRVLAVLHRRQVYEDDLCRAGGAR